MHVRTQCTCLGLLFVLFGVKVKKELQKTKHRAPAYPLPYLFPSLSAANISPSSSLLLIRLSQAVFLQACTWLTDTHTWHAVWSCSLGWTTGQETPGGKQSEKQTRIKGRIINFKLRLFDMKHFFSSPPKSSVLFLSHLDSRTMTRAKRFPV